jgi:signal transduction histidine kinase
MIFESPEARENMARSFEFYERPIRIRNYKLGAMLAGIFMPAGASLDFFMYGLEQTKSFFSVRVFSAVLLAGVWLALHYFPNTPHYRHLGRLVALLPLAAISWMIYIKDGAISPYYAGLNLIMLGSAILLRWTVADSVLIFGLTLATYMAAVVLHGEFSLHGLFFNNIYFLIVTGIFIIAGSWYYNIIRQSEFQLRYRLDANRAELEESNQKLRELDEAKSRFFANISHELRTPLTLMIAPLESLLHNPAAGRMIEEHELLKTMHANAMRLLKLINDLLELVRLESGGTKIRPKPVEIEEFVHGIATAVGAVAKDKQINLRSSVTPEVGVVMTDPEKLERITLNLIFNALKFTAANGRVDFTARTEDEWMIIEVKDTGMGIPSEQLPHIFGRFWQADTSSQRKFQGMGIGLGLVKELVEIQGGSVSAASEVGIGTTMTVKLPLKHPEPADLAEAEPAEGHHDPAEHPEGMQKDWIAELYRRAELFPAMTSLQATVRPIETSISRSRKPKLLIADDEPDMLRFLKSQLSANFEIFEAVDGQQAVDKAAQFLPDIILSDMMMPEKDGLQVCRELRDRTSTRNIPIVLLTARADEKTKLDCLEAGASDFLPKPFSLTEVIVRLKNLADSRLYQKEIFSQKQQLEAALEQIKETESMLVQNEKLAAMGRLSAGLIHEINNPLNYARQGLHVLSKSSKHLPESELPDFNETLKDVEEGITRVAQIIADLRGFTRETKDFHAIFEIKNVVDTGLRFFSHVWKGGAQREVDVPAGLQIRGDANQFTQVFINLVQNALDAMDTKTYPEGEKPMIRIHGEQRGSKVIFSMRDNGPGIPASIRDKIFDPFFTTKDVGKGMGLGLSICNRIISDHGGRVEVRSERGAYTEFVLEFPTIETPDFT